MAKNNENDPQKSTENPRIPEIVPNPAHRFPMKDGKVLAGPGRPKGQRNKITIARQNFIDALNKATSLTDIGDVINRSLMSNDARERLAATKIITEMMGARWLQTDTGDKTFAVTIKRAYKDGDCHQCSACGHSEPIKPAADRPTKQSSDESAKQSGESSAETESQEGNSL